MFNNCDVIHVDNNVTKTMPLDKKYVETLGVMEVRSYLCDDDSIKEAMDMMEFQARNIEKVNFKSDFDLLSDRVRPKSHLTR